MALAIAARRSAKQTTLIFENPADRSGADEHGAVYDAKFATHGSLFATSAFKRLVAATELTHATFAYCRLDSPYQKYTSLYYTPEARGILDALNAPEFKCNHPRGTHHPLKWPGSLPLRSNLRRVPAPWFEGGRLRARAPRRAP